MNRSGVSGVRAGPACVAAVVLCAVNLDAARADLPSYQLVGSYEIPPGVWDVLGDGRVVVMQGNRLWMQDAVHAPNFSAIGSIDPALLPAWGASFVRVSPDGETVAIGDNRAGLDVQTVHLVDWSSLNTGGVSATRAVVAANYDAVWMNSATLMVSGTLDDFSGSVVTRIDAASGEARVVIDDIGGGAGGVTTDGVFLYTGNGFDSQPGGSETGEVRAIELAMLGIDPVSFESVGIGVADALSAGSLGLDALGNLLVGGGDFIGGDLGYAAVVDGDAIAAALAGGGIAPDGSELRLTPTGDGVFYDIRWNGATAELLVAVDTAGQRRMFRYVVPTPGSTAAAIAILALGMGRRSRRERKAVRHE